MDIGQIVSALNQLAGEVDKLKISGKGEQAGAENNENTGRLARAYPIKSHILAKSDEAVRKYYLTALAALFLKDEDGEDRTSQLLLIGRIIASFSDEIDLESYIVKSLQTDDRFWNSFFELINGKHARCFIVDAMVLSINKSGLFSDRVSIISDMMQLFGMNRESAGKGISIARAIIEQDFDKFADLVDEDGSWEYNSFLGYFGSIHYTYISNNADACKTVNGKLLITSWETSNRKKVIDLDDFQADEICFRKCRFVNIKGMKGFLHKIRFEHCYFERNPLKVEDGWNQKAEKNYTFIQGKNLEFADTEFESCRASKHLLDIKGRIDRCSFRNCSGISLPRTYLFSLKNSAVTDSVFENCAMETSHDNNSVTYGGLMAAKQSKVYGCRFINCSSYGRSSYGSYSRYAMQILAAVDTSVTDCEFHKCSCRAVDAYCRTITSNILGMKNASEKGNMFQDCTSYNCNLGNGRGTHHDIGELKEGE